METNCHHSELYIPPNNQSFGHSVPYNPLTMMCSSEIKAMFYCFIITSLFITCFGERKTKRDASNDTVRVVTMDVEPYMIRTDGGYEGYIPDLMAKLAEYVGIEKYELFIVKDGKYGTKQIDGLWTGIAGTLTRHEADMALAPFTINSMRQRILDFSYPFMRAGITTLFKKPPQDTSPLPFMWLFNLFTVEVWIVILFVTAICCIFMYLLNRFGAKPNITNEDSGTCSFESRKLCAAVARIMGIVQNQPTSMSILMVTWRTFFLLTVVLYMSTLVTFLSVSPEPDLQVPYSNVTELANTDIPFTYENGSTAEFFRTSRQKLYRRMAIKHEEAYPTNKINTHREGLEKVRAGNFALIGDSPTLEYSALTNCDLMMVGENVNQAYFGVAFHFDSEYLDRVNLAIIEFHEKGLLDKLYKKWWTDRAKCRPVEAYKGPPHGSEKVTRSVTLHQFGKYGSLVLLAIGLALTVVVAVIERMLQNRENGHGKNNGNADNCSKGGKSPEIVA